MATTASKWLADNPGDLDVLTDVLKSSGIKISIFTELPRWQQQNISNQLLATFQQPFWASIQKATAGAAASALTEGLAGGLSITEMARRIRDSLGGNTPRYARIRARAIARTESTNALNSTRKAGMDRLAEDAPDLPMAAVWLSVLGNTTRDSHAVLDGVPADENGEWDLSGTSIPWPGHWMLPPEERINCLCTTILQFGEPEKGILTSGDFLEDTLAIIQGATGQIKRNVARTTFIRHIRLTGKDLAKVIAPILEDSIKELAGRLEAMSKAASPAATALVQAAFNEQKWTNKLIDKSLPILAIRMAEAAKIQLAEMRRDSPEAVARLSKN